MQRPTRAITWTAAKPGLTLAELAAFVEQARASGTPDTATVSGRIFTGGGLREIRVAAAAPPPEPAP